MKSKRLQPDATSRANDAIDATGASPRSCGCGSALTPGGSPRELRSETAFDDEDVDGCRTDNVVVGTNRALECGPTRPPSVAVKSRRGRAVRRVLHAIGRSRRTRCRRDDSAHQSRRGEVGDRGQRDRRVLEHRLDDLLHDGSLRRARRTGANGVAHDGAHHLRCAHDRNRKCGRGARRRRRPDPPEPSASPRARHRERGAPRRRPRRIHRARRGGGGAARHARYPLFAVDKPLSAR